MKPVFVVLWSVEFGNQFFWTQGLIHTRDHTKEMAVALNSNENKKKLKIPPCWGRENKFLFSCTTPSWEQSSSASYHIAQVQGRVLLIIKGGANYCMERIRLNHGRGGLVHQSSDSLGQSIEGLGLICTKENIGFV